MTEAADAADAAAADWGPGDAEDEHLADLAAVERRLAEVEAALARLDEGSYGRCAVCGAPIADADLEADPVRSTCSGCRGA